MAPPHSGKTKSQRDKEYRKRLLAAGKCIQCTEPLDRKGSRCQQCVDITKQKRDQKRANALCTTCGKPKGDVTGSLCETCKQDAVDRRLRLKEAELCIDCAEPALSGHSRCAVCKQANLSRYREWGAAGLCTRCGDNKEQQTKSHCNKCLDYIKTYRRELITELTDANLCISCLGENDSSNQFCKTCQSEKSIVYEQRKLLGQCVKCALPAQKNLSHCITCLEVFSERYYSKKELGICVSCSGEKLEHTHHCLECWLKLTSYRALGNREQWKELQQLLFSQNFKCAYTGVTLIPGLNTSVDHIIPKSRGGSNDITNIQWILKPLNTLKGELTHDEFISNLQNYLKLIQLILERNSAEITCSSFDLGFLSNFTSKNSGNPTNLSSIL